MKINFRQLSDDVVATLQRTSTHAHFARKVRVEGKERKLESRRQMRRNKNSLRFS